MKLTPLKQHIYRFLISFVLAVSVNGIFAQQQKDTIEAKVPLFQGIRLDIDISPVITTLISKGETYSFEGAVQTKLLGKYFPIVEAGFAGANKSSWDNIHFKTNGAFVRVGTDFNVLKQKNTEKKYTNYFLLGARLGFTTFGYDLQNIVVTDYYFNETKTFNFDNQIAAKVWFEIAASVRVEIFKNIYLGWTIRNKNMLTNDKEGKISPSFVPGFGVNNTSNWGVNYALGYRF